MWKVQNVSLVAFLSFCMVVGALVFARGFLLNRQVVQAKAGPCAHSSRVVHIRGGEEAHLPREGGGLGGMGNWCSHRATFPKLILMLVDALRHDFVQRMKFLSEVRNGSEGATACSFKFLADPPTTTMQRLKALMTGTMPTFIDASANFNSYEVQEDSLIHQLYSMGKRIAFLGDDTWLSLFPQTYFTSRFVEAHPSFNAWDLDTVDRAVNKTLHHPDLFRAGVSDWDVLITHLLGVDHCGHRYGPNHPEMKRKLDDADGIVRHVFNSMDDDTLLVVFGDHGMTSSGDHGGDSKDEMESTVIFLSKRSPKLSPPFHCTNQGVSISQIDLVPTLALLQGIPIPYSNIGQLIPEFLPVKMSSDAIAANIAQVQTYIKHFPTILMSPVDGLNDSSNLLEQYMKIEEAFQNFSAMPDQKTRRRLETFSEQYLKKVKAVAVSTWTQFNVPMIYMGVAITALSVVSLFVYLVSVSLIFKSQCSTFSVLSWLWPALCHCSILCTFFYHAVASTALLGIVMSTLLGLIIFLVFSIFRLIRRCDREIVKSVVLGIFSNVPTIICVIVYVFTCLAVFSNSFVVYEGHVLGFSVCVVAFIQAISTKRRLVQECDTQSSILTCLDSSTFFRSTPIFKKTCQCVWSCFFLLLLLMRLSFIFFRCREEQQTCTEEFLLHKQLASLPEAWFVHKYLRYGVALLVLAVYVVSLRHWLIYRNCIFSKKPRALIARFVPSALVVLLGVFWALQGLPFISPYASKIPLLMNYLPIIYQVVNISAIIVVALKPICCIGHLSTLHHSKHKDVKIVPARVLCKTSQSGSITNGVKCRSAAISNGCGKLPCDSPSSLAEAVRHSIEAPMSYEICSTQLCDCFNEDTYSSCFLTLSSLVTLLLVQVVSTGIAPSVIIEAFVLICLVGMYKSGISEHSGSWTSAIAWTLVSQYFFYATGHQPIFSAIPWDSAFVGGNDASGLTSGPGAWLAWLRAGLAVIGNLHVSQILSSVSLPLLVYWSSDKRRLESLMGGLERHKVFMLFGKFLLLHGLKLLLCMSCAAWHRRHLMVWKIFAPKFIFEAVSFIVTSFVSLLTMVFLVRVNYSHQKFLGRASEGV